MSASRARSSASSSNRRYVHRSAHSGQYGYCDCGGKEGAATTCRRDANTTTPANRTHLGGKDFSEDVVCDDAHAVWLRPVTIQHIPAAGGHALQWRTGTHQAINNGVGWGDTKSAAATIQGDRERKQPHRQATDTTSSLRHHNRQETHSTRRGEHKLAAGRGWRVRQRPPRRR